MLKEQPDSLRDHVAPLTLRDSTPPLLPGENTCLRASVPDRWPEAHATRGRVRDKLLKTCDAKLSAQYYFAEACLESLYNETNPDDPFDSVSPFWVVPHALTFAETLGPPHSLVTAALRGDA